MVAASLRDHPSSWVALYCTRNVSCHKEAVELFKKALKSEKEVHSARDTVMVCVFAAANFSC